MTWRRMWMKWHRNIIMIQILTYYFIVFLFSSSTICYCSLWMKVRMNFWSVNCTRMCHYAVMLWQLDLSAELSAHLLEFIDYLSPVIEKASLVQIDCWQVFSPVGVRPRTGHWGHCIEVMQVWVSQLLEPPSCSCFLFALTWKLNIHQLI